MKCPSHRFKLLFANRNIVTPWVEFASAQWALGEPDLESVRMMPIQDPKSFDRLRNVVLHQPWRFSTPQGENLLLFIEIRTEPDFNVLMRLLAYALVVYITPDFISKGPIPDTRFLLIYTGTKAWTPPDTDGPTPSDGCSPQPPLYYYMDLLHGDFSTWDLPRELELIIQAERTRTPKELLTNGFLTGVKALPDPRTERPLVEFMNLTIRGWARHSDHDRKILAAMPRVGETATTTEELAMAARTYQRGYFAVKEEGRWEGARKKEIEILREVLLPVLGRESVDALQKRMDSCQHTTGLDVNTVIDLRIRYGTDTSGLRRAIQNHLEHKGMAT